ncbi:MAG: hypothetical protein J6B01_04590 [Ruminococcus sp.]|nr:hypothetical protein [Ruminococcus sp.]
MGKWYTILGVTEEMAESGELRDDVLVFRNEYGVEAKIRLNWFEAMIMRWQMRKVNRITGSNFNLVKDLS